MASSKIKFVTFDVDGTILDSQNMIIKCLQLACADLDIDCSAPRKQLLSGVGLPLTQAVPTALPHIKQEQISPFVERFRAHYEVLKEQVLELQPLFPGALEMLETLKSKGYTLGIFTSKMKSGLDSVLDSHNIRRLFSVIKTPDNGPGKPDPFLLNQSMAELGFTPDQTIFVGDSTYDILAGRAANAGTLGVSWGYHTAAQLQEVGAHKMIDRMEDLIPAVENW